MDRGKLPVLLDLHRVEGALRVGMLLCIATVDVSVRVCVCAYPLSGICVWIEENFPYYSTCTEWKVCVCVSLCVCGCVCPPFLIHLHKGGGVCSYSHACLK